MNGLLVATLLAAADASSAPGEAPAAPARSEPSPAPSVDASSPQVVSRTTSEPVAGQLWGVVTPRTLGRNGNALEAGFGYPGFSGSYLHGVLPNLDLGVQISANYGIEGQVSRVLPELKVQALLKYRLMDNGHVSLGVRFEPGPLFSFYSNRTAPGFALPVGLNLGIVATSALNIGVMFDVPLWLQFGTNSSAIIPVLMGAGAEYFVSSSLAVWFALRMGPSLWTNGAPAQFTFDGRLGVGWRF